MGKDCCGGMEVPHTDNPIIQKSLGIEEKLDVLDAEFQREQHALVQKYAALKTPIFKARDAVVSPAVSDFWSTALLNHSFFAAMCSKEEQEFIPKFLKTIKVTRGEGNSFTLTFEFSENTYFSNKTIEKKIFVPTGGHHQEFESSKINWKQGKTLLFDAEEAQAAAAGEKRKRIDDNDKSTVSKKSKSDGKDADEEDDEEDFLNEFDHPAGGLFNWLVDEEAEPETVEVAEMLAEDLYPQASKYYLGAIGGHDHDDEDDEDDDEDENEDDEEDEVEDD